MFLIAMVQGDTVHVYEVWEGDESESLVRSDFVERLKKTGHIGESDKRLYTIQAATAEEASAIWHIRSGYKPYTPMGRPELCPKGCGIFFYPEGSAECANCGRIEREETL